MPVLKMEKWELYARGLSVGLTQHKAYVEAGFENSKSSKQAASLLLKRHPEILERVEEIKQEKYKIFERADAMPLVRILENEGINKARVIQELWHNAMIGKAAIPVLDKEGNQTGVYGTMNLGASNNALIQVGKELGLFLEKSEDNTKSKHSNKTDAEMVEMLNDKMNKLGIRLDSPIEIIEDAVEVK